jgi:hypothetical protein
MRFKYSTTDSSQNQFDSLPRIPLVLSLDNRAVEVVGLLDSGATWDERKAIIQLFG